MKVKFFKVADTEIVKAYIHNDNGDRVSKCIALIGQVAELLDKKVIFEDNTEGNEEKWLIVYPDATICQSEFATKAEAKQFVKANAPFEFYEAIEE